jgi:hypothetical protein
MRFVESSADTLRAHKVGDVPVNVGLVGQVRVELVDACLGVQAIKGNNHSDDAFGKNKEAPTQFFPKKVVRLRSHAIIV